MLIQWKNIKMSYDIVCYISDPYKKALIKFMPTWLTSDVDKIHVYCDHGMEFPQEFHQNNKIEL
jgi:hypothetical protein